jgi:hypothetical protein
MLQFAFREGYFPAVPTGLPALKQFGKTVLEIPADDDVAKISQWPRHRVDGCSF